jgi:hypothetical protein
MNSGEEYMRLQLLAAEIVGHIFSKRELKRKPRTYETSEEENRGHLFLCRQGDTYYEIFPQDEERWKYVITNLGTTVMEGMVRVDPDKVAPLSHTIYSEGSWIRNFNVSRV